VVIVSDFESPNIVCSSSKPEDDIWCMTAPDYETLVESLKSREWDINLTWRLPYLSVPFMPMFENNSIGLVPRKNRGLAHRGGSIFLQNGRMILQNSFIKGGHRE
jgi:hypothetical protein